MPRDLKMPKARPRPKEKAVNNNDYAQEERNPRNLCVLVEDILPTRNTVADAPLYRIPMVC